MSNNQQNLPSDNQSESEERRHTCPSKHALWAQLSVVQQASVSSMYNYGYALSFIRTENAEMNVVMTLNEAVIVINEEGDIDTHANIQIRK